MKMAAEEIKAPHEMPSAMSWSTSAIEVDAPSAAIGDRRGPDRQAKANAGTCGRATPRGT
jgi:hypothetical protein